MKSTHRYRLTQLAAEARYAERLAALERLADDAYDRAAALADAEAAPVAKIAPDVLLRRQRLAWAVADLIGEQLICCDQSNFVSLGAEIGSLALLFGHTETRPRQWTAIRSPSAASDTCPTSVAVGL